LLLHSCRQVVLGWRGRSTIHDAMWRRGRRRLSLAGLRRIIRVIGVEVKHPYLHITGTPHSKPCAPASLRDQTLLCPSKRVRLRVAAVLRRVLIVAARGVDLLVIEN
jgi:hypothetical protein